MSNIFAGLEDLGFKNVEKVDVYQESDSEKKKQEAAKPTMICPQLSLKSP